MTFVTGLYYNVQLVIKYPCNIIYCNRPYVRISLTSIILNNTISHINQYKQWLMKTILESHSSVFANTIEPIIPSIRHSVNGSNSPGMGIIVALSLPHLVDRDRDKTWFCIYLSSFPLSSWVFVCLCQSIC